MLLYAITWPAAWLKNKQLHIQPKHYKHIIITKINDIKQHGNPQHYEAYFPRYLLKTLQDHFAHNQDKLYYELKSISYSINSIITAINNLPNTPNTTYLSTIAQAHHIIKNQYQQKKHHSQTNQMTLNL